MIIKKKSIKNIIFNKRINKLKNFAILFNTKTNTLHFNRHLNRIKRTKFLEINKKIFSDKNLPANIYFYEYESLNELNTIKENVILIKYKNNYFYKTQINSLILENNIAHINHILGFYKKFYFILKTISLKK